jgi:predicted membrane channel-forming protein YqfA (hemolysin III family)
LAALAASVWLLFGLPNRWVALVAFLASGLEVLVAFKLVRINIPVLGTSTALILGGVLLVAGGIAYAKATVKSTVGAASLTTLAGAIQLCWALRLLK